MNAKGVLVSVMCIALVAMLAGAGTLAYFSDTETSTGNTFTAGTMDLKVRDDGGWSDGLTATWRISNMIPGVSEDQAWISLKNYGSIDADHVEISISNTCTEAGTEESDTMPDSAEGMDKYIEILELKYDGLTSLLYSGVDDPNVDDDDPATDWNDIDDQNGNGFIDLDDFEQNPVDDLEAPAANAGPGPMFEMKVKFHSSAPNDYQGDICDMTMTFTLNQDSSQ